jgi:hypothetical protein
MTGQGIAGAKQRACKEGNHFYDKKFESDSILSN